MPRSSPDSTSGRSPDSPDREVAQFDKAPFSIEQAEEFTLLATPYLPSRHLKRKTLGVAEKDGSLTVTRPPGARAGSFLPGTVLRFA